MSLQAVPDPNAADECPWSTKLTLCSLLIVFAFLVDLTLDIFAMVFWKSSNKTCSSLPNLTDEILWGLLIANLTIFLAHMFLLLVLTILYSYRDDDKILIDPDSPESLPKYTSLVYLTRSGLTCVKGFAFLVVMLVHWGNGFLTNDACMAPFCLILVNLVVFVLGFCLVGLCETIKIARRSKISVESVQTGYPMVSGTPVLVT